MDALIRYGLSIEEIKNMINSNDELNTVSDKNINKIIEILEGLGCSKEQIKNIMNTNPFLISRELDELKKLLVKLLDFGLEDLQIVIDTNPFILNIDYKEIDQIYKQKKKEGLTEEEIKDYFYYESYKMI